MIGSQIRAYMVGPLLALLWLWFWPVERLRTAFMRGFHSGYAIDLAVAAILLLPPLIAFGVPFLVTDIVFNLVFGSFIFWERPKEWLFSTRLSRWIEADQTTEGYRLANELCYQLRKIDPYHC